MARHACLSRILGEVNENVSRKANTFFLESLYGHHFFYVNKTPPLRNEYPSAYLFRFTGIRVFVLPKLFHWTIDTVE